VRGFLFLLSHLRHVTPDGYYKYFEGYLSVESQPVSYAQCADGRLVSDSPAGRQIVQDALRAMKAEGKIDQDMLLVFKTGLSGGASVRTIDGKKAVIVNSDIATCLTQRQWKAVIGHENKHFQPNDAILLAQAADVLAGMAGVVAVATIGGRALLRSKPIQLYPAAESKSKERKWNLGVLAAIAAAYIASSAGNFAAYADEERSADRAAAVTVGNVDEVKDMLGSLDIKVSYVAPQHENTSSVKPKEPATSLPQIPTLDEIVDYVRAGPFVIFLDTHASDKKRIELLEAARPAIERQIASQSKHTAG